MSTIAALYNTLPTLQEADAKFVNREETFSKLAPLFAAYDNKFGVCLVHRHCTLEEGEVMVATENVSQPERDIQYYPERWLANGQPYEFNRQDPGIIPPETLVNKFQEIVGDVGVLGIFYIWDQEKVGGEYVERTEGRKNIVEHVSNSTGNNTETCWSPGYGGTVVKCSCTPPSHMHPCDGCPYEKRILLISCSEVDVSQPVPGTPFRMVQRNFANQFHKSDSNATSDLTFAVLNTAHLKPGPVNREVHVVGHDNCAGVIACHNEANGINPGIPPEPVIWAWLRPLLDHARRNPNQSLEALTRQNVRMQVESVKNVLKTMGNPNVKVKGFVQVGKDINPVPELEV